MIAVYPQKQFFDIPITGRNVVDENRVFADCVVVELADRQVGDGEFVLESLADRGDGSFVAVIPDDDIANAKFM